MATTSDGAKCDVCGEWCSWDEMVETIEEYLCDRCASGIDDEEDDDGDDE